MQSNKNKILEILMPPAVGYSFRILLMFLFEKGISLKYLHRLIVLGIINIINFPFRSWERIFINPRITKNTISEPPIFIIGHWRSGTTHLHNLLSQDEQMGYVTTYQGVFPDTLFNKGGRFLFKNFTRLLIPRTREGDNVTLDPDNPQEEEFALGDKTPVCYYYFWMFPRDTLHYYIRFIRFNGISPSKIEAWKKDYHLLIKKALKNTNRKRFLSKNPSNTGRIKVLLEMFPDARFIYIHRNPVEVFLSTQHFFDRMMPHLQLQNIHPDEQENIILTVYKNILSDYFEQRDLIPQGHLVEISFNDLERNPLQVAELIYKQLNLPGFEKAKPAFAKYVEQMKYYKKNKHSISRDQLEKIMEAWDFAMRKHNYPVSENIIIKDD